MRATTDPATMTPQRARAILAVGADATPDEVEGAFRRAIRTAHPDRGGEPNRAQVLLDARRCLRAAAHDTAGTGRSVIVVPAPTWRDLVAAIVQRLRPRSRRRPPPRVR